MGSQVQFPATGLQEGYPPVAISQAFPCRSLLLPVKPRFLRKIPKIGREHPEADAFSSFCPPGRNDPKCVQPVRLNRLKQKTVHLFAPSRLFLLYKPSPPLCPGKPRWQALQAHQTKKLSGHGPSQRDSEVLRTLDRTLLIPMISPPHNPTSRQGG